MKFFKIKNSYYRKRVKISKYTEFKVKVEIEIGLPIQKMEINRNLYDFSTFFYKYLLNNLVYFDICIYWVLFFW